MREPVGHEDVRRHLERLLPPVTLLLAPRGTEAWALGDYLLRFHGVQAADLVKVVKLDAVGAKNMLVQQQMRAMGAGGMGLLINLDKPAHVADRIHEQNLNRLLTMLERPNGKIVMVASGRTLPTVESRTMTYRLGLLTDAEVQTALRRYGREAGFAEAVKLGGTLYGRQVLEAEGYLKSNVDAVLKAVQDRDRSLLSVSMQGWKSEADGRVALRMLKGWVTEALIGKWVRYSEDAAPALAKDRAKLKALLVDLSHYHGNPKIVATAALDKHMGR